MAESWEGTEKLLWLRGTKTKFTQSDFVHGIQQNQLNKWKFLVACLVTM